MKNRSRLLAASAVAAALALVTGCRRSPAATANNAPPPPEIPVVRVMAQTTPDVLTFTGRLDAVHRIEVRPRVTGHVTTVHFREGDLVRAGDLLLEIDSRPYFARRNQAAANAARADAAYQLARQEGNRALDLRTADAISTEEFERRTAEVAATQAARMAAEAELATAELELEFTYVRAPAAGRIGRALVTPGNLANADATVLTTLVSVDPMRVRFSIDEPTFQRLLTLPPHQPAAARVSVQGFAAPFSAQVDFLGNSVDTATGTVEVRASLADFDFKLVDGMFARVELLLPAATGRVIVPETALGAEQGSRYVLVANAENKLVQRRVTLGPRAGQDRAISGDLAAGDFIVAGGLQFLRPGMTIRPLKPAADPVATPSAQ